MKKIELRQLIREEISKLKEESLHQPHFTIYDFEGGEIFIYLEQAEEDLYSIDDNIDYKPSQIRYIYYVKAEQYDQRIALNPDEEEDVKDKALDEYDIFPIQLIFGNY